MFWAAHYVVTRGGTLYRLIAALVVLALCGLGFWWLEPTTPTFGDALWLAFTTAATVGYGDSVPTTPASKIFAVFVVFLGVGAITLVAAAHRLGLDRQRGTPHRARDPRRPAQAAAPGACRAGRAARGDCGRRSHRHAHAPQPPRAPVAEP